MCFLDPAPLFSFLQTALRRHSCLYQHIKRSSCGACQTPVTNCDYEWHRGDLARAVAQAQRRAEEPVLSQALKPTPLSNLIELQSWSTPGLVTCDLIAIESFKQCLLYKATVLTLAQTQTANANAYTTPFLFSFFPSAHISARGVTRTVCLISVSCLVITQIKGQGTA